MRRLVPKRHAMLVVMSPIAVRQPRIGDRIRTHIVSTDHGAGVVLPCGHRVFREQFAATMWTRVGHWHNVAVDVARCFRDLTNDAKSIRVVLAFCFARLEPRIGNAVGTLPRILLTGNRPCGIAPAPHAVGLAVVPVLALFEARIGHRKRTIGGATAAGHRAAWLGPSPDTEHAAAFLADVRHDGKIPEQPVDNFELLQAAPIGARLHERESHPGFPLQPRNPVHRPAGRITR